MELDIYTSITELTAVYETLNECLTSDPCTTDAYQVYRQQTYRDACATLQAMPVEPIVPSYRGRYQRPGSYPSTGFDPGEYPYLRNS